MNRSIFCFVKETLPRRFKSLEPDVKQYQKSRNWPFSLNLQSVFLITEIAFHHFSGHKSSIIRSPNDKGRWYRTQQWTIICFIPKACKPTLHVFSRGWFGSSAVANRASMFQRSLLSFISVLIQSTWFVPQTPESLKRNFQLELLIRDWSQFHSFFPDGCRWLAWLRAPETKQCRSGVPLVSLKKKLIS